MHVPITRYLAALGLFTVLGAASAYAQSPAESLDRTVLPITEPEPPTYTELDVRNTQPPPRFEVTAPEGAPNFKAHLACGERGITHIECLWNLEALVGQGRFTFIGFPLKIRGGTASPIRAVAVFED